MTHLKVFRLSAGSAELAAPGLSFEKALHTAVEKHPDALVAVQREAVIR